MLVNNSYLLNFLLSLPCCLAIKCVRSNSDQPSVTNECEGDYCFKMRTSDSSSSVIYTQQFNITDGDKGTKLGPVCVAEGILWEETPMFHFTYLSSRVHAFPIYVHPPYDPRFNIYYHGEMYRLQYRENQVEFAQYCVEDNCNRMDFLSVKPGNVTCVLYTEQQSRTICHGQFCVYGYAIFQKFDQQVDNAESTVYWQYCLSTNSSASDYAIQVGTYSAYGTTYLICNTENCNKDQQAAVSAIEKHNQEELRKDNTRVFEVNETKEDNTSVHQQSITNTAILVSFFYFTCPPC